MEPGARLRGAEPRVQALLRGGARGAKARPLEPEWMRAVREPRDAAGVAFFMIRWKETALPAGRAAACPPRPGAPACRCREPPGAGLRLPR
ncbi:DUF5131 family protein [Corallococcus sp. RDP092CA]|uniref:DUF5131 family protein n=1 Tax=Corallococcus sp. RDP092CA TaxID=3109369 RepID=UPI0035AEB937